MDLKDQVCSLELSKRLKELGVKQESYFFWYSAFKDSEVTVWHSYQIGSDTERAFSAFTVAELGEMLPDYVNPADYQGARSLGISKSMDGWHITYSTSEKWWHREVADTEADARAKMLIYLIENKLITI